MKKIKGTQSQFSLQKLSDVVSNYKQMDQRGMVPSDRTKHQNNNLSNGTNITINESLMNLARNKLSEKKRQSSIKENVFSIQLKNIVQHQERNYTDRVKTASTPKSHTPKMGSMKFQSNIQQSARVETSIIQQSARADPKKSISTDLNSDRNARIKQTKPLREKSFNLKLNSMTPQLDKNISFSGRDQSTTQNRQSGALQSQLNRMMNNKLGSFTGRDGREGKVKKQEDEGIEDISIHLKNLINFCNQSIQNKEKNLNSEESKQHVPLIEIKSLNLNIIDDNTENDFQETARFNQEDNEIKKMKEMLAQKLTRKKELLNQLINSKGRENREPLMIMDNRFNSKGMQKLVQSKSVSPSHNEQKCDDESSQFQRLIDQLQECQIKQNVQGGLVKIAQISIESDLEFNKTCEKKIRSQIQHIQGLKIKNDKQVQLSVPFMKAFFSSSLLYLNLSNNGIKQNTLQLSLIMLQYIDVSGNQLENLNIINNCTSLEEIQASNNMIACVDGLTNLKQLIILELSSNKIKSFETILQLKRNDTVKQINLQNNPVSKYPNYQRFIKQILPNCVKVDGDIVEGTNINLFGENTKQPQTNKRYCHYDDYQKQFDLRVLR